MRSAAAYALLATGTLAAASVERRWDWPVDMPIQARQEPGTPRYLCHENCGTGITLSREEGYCTNAEFNQRFQACLECANTFGIWMYYTNSLTPAAAACGLSAVPSPSGWEPEPEPTPEPSPSPPPSSSDEPLPSSTDEPVPSSSDAVTESSTTDDASSTAPPPSGSASEPPSVNPSATGSVSVSEPEPSGSASASASASDDESSVSASASASETEEPSSVPSGTDGASSEPCPESSSIYVPVPSGNSTTLCTTTTKPGEPYPTGGEGYPTKPGEGPDYSGPISVPSPTPSFEPSSANKVLGSFFGVAVAAVAVLAL